MKAHTRRQRGRLVLRGQEHVLNANPKRHQTQIAKYATARMSTPTAGEPTSCKTHDHDDNGDLDELFCCRGCTSMKVSGYRAFVTIPPVLVPLAHSLDFQLQRDTRRTPRPHGQTNLHRSTTSVLRGHAQRCASVCAWEYRCTMLGLLCRIQGSICCVVSSPSV